MNPDLSFGRGQSIPPPINAVPPVEITARIAGQTFKAAGQTAEEAVSNLDTKVSNAITKAECQIELMEGFLAAR